MNKMKEIIQTVLLFFCLVSSGIDAHGMLMVPPARTSAWREFGKNKFPEEYTDNQMFCGGINVQWKQNEGKCGICGEDWALPKLWEKGGVNYRGTSVRNYTQGQTIDVFVLLTANHNGWMEFRVCNIDDSSSDATQSCLDKTLLADSTGKTRFRVDPTTYDFRFQLVLPSSLACKHCVFQWIYNCGNNWGTDPTTGQACIGCGPQEQFYVMNLKRMCGYYN